LQCRNIALNNRDRPSSHGETHAKVGFGKSKEKKKKDLPRGEPKRRTRGKGIQGARVMRAVARSAKNVDELRRGTQVLNHNLAKEPHTGPRVPQKAEFLACATYIAIIRTRATYQRFAKRSEGAKQTPDFRTWLSRPLPSQSSSTAWKVGLRNGARVISKNLSGREGLSREPPEPLGAFNENSPSFAWIIFLPR